MALDPCNHAWKPWEVRAAWNPAPGSSSSTEYSWVRACSLCGGCEFQRMGGDARPRDDAAVAGWYFGAD